MDAASITVQRDYDIHNPKPQSYRITVPQKIVEELNLEESVELGVEIGISDGCVYIDYVFNPTPSMVTRTLTIQNPLIRIPSGIGDVMQAGNQSVNWSIRGENESQRLRAQTSYTPLEITDGEWTVLKSMLFTPTVQTVSGRDGKSEQEHFDILFTEEETEILNWDSETELGLLLVSHKGEPAIRLQPVDESFPDNLRTKSVTRSGFKQKDARIYISRALIRSLGWDDMNVDVFHRGDVAVIAR